MLVTVKFTSLLWLIKESPFTKITDAYNPCNVLHTSDALKMSLKNNPYLAASYHCRRYFTYRCF